MALPSADEQRTLRKGMPFLSVRSFTLTNSELITKKTIYTKILTLPINHNLEIPRKTIIHIYYDGELSIFSIEEKNFLKEVTKNNI